MFTKTAKRCLVALLAVVMAGTTMGTIAFAADDSTPAGVKRDPVALYEFKDSANLGKDSMGNYDLVLGTRNGGTATKVDGGIHFDGNSMLFDASGNLNTLLNSANFTLVASFMPDSTNADQSGIVGMGRDGWDYLGLMFRTQGNGQHLRVAGVATDTNPDWSPDVGDMSGETATYAAATADYVGKTVEVFAKGDKMNVSNNSYRKVTSATGDGWTAGGTVGGFGIGGQYRSWWCSVDKDLNGSVQCFTGTVYQVRIYDFVLTEEEIKTVWNGEEIYDTRSISDVSAVTLSGVCASATDTDAVILAMANAKSSNKNVTVTLSDESVHTGVVTWDTVVRDGDKIYVEAPIAFVVNPDDRKVRAEVTVGDYSAIDPLAKYEFKDAANPGKDSMGNFDLVKYGEGTVTVENGEATFDGQAALAAEFNANDISEYLDSFTLVFELNRNATQIVDWPTVIGFGFKNGVEQWNTFHFYSSDSLLRYTASSKLVDGVSDIDGHANMYWGHDIQKCNAGDYCQVALSVQKGGKLRIYFNSSLIDSKVFDVPADYSLASEILSFAIGGTVTDDGFGYGFVGSLRNVAIYDFAMDATQVSIAQNGGYLTTGSLTDENVVVSKFATELTFEDDEVTSAALYADMSEEEMFALLNEATVKVTLSNRESKQLPVKWEKVVERDGAYYAVTAKLFGIGYASEFGPQTFEQELTVLPVFNVVVADSIENGTVEVDAASARIGTTVTVTATANEGWNLASITVNGEQITANEDGTYTFVLMANSTVSAQFEEDVSELGSCYGNFQGAGYMVVLMGIACLAVALKRKHA